MFKQIGIIGAGQMGSGIGQVAATAGYAAVIYDLHPEALTRAQQAIETSLSKLTEKKTITKTEAKSALKNLVFTDTLKDLAKCELVIEAATENEAIKKKIFTELDALLGKRAIIATNTSSLSITRLAAATTRPEQFVGLHFMNPVPIMPLVEVINGLRTSAATTKKITNFAIDLGKTVATAADQPGFIVNRLLLPMLNEAAFCLQNGVADAKSLDTAMKLGAGHPMGPLQLADFIGLDTCVAIMRVLHTELGDSKYRPCPLLVKYVDAGWLGRKSGRGFYVYD